MLFGRTHHFHFPPDLKLILHHFKKFCLATASEKERHNETGHMHRSQRLSEEMSQLKKSREDGEDSEVQYDVFLYTSEHNAQWYLTKILQFVV